MINKKRIIIIMTIALVVFGIIGSIYFIANKKENKVELKDPNEISIISEESTTNSAIDDANKIYNESENNIIEENKITEENNESTEETEKKQETQTSINNKQQTTQAKSNSSSNLSSTPKKENVTQSTGSQTSTPTATPETKSDSKSSNSQTDKQEETKTENKIERCTNNNNHGMNIGNSGKWFNSKNDAITYHDNQTKYWGDQWENNKIDNDTYYKNCPSGYEVWDCMYCGKWTINFYYR